MANTSVRASIPRPSTCSGAAYPGVPSAVVPAPRTPAAPAVEALALFARPKSTIFSVPSEARRRFLDVAVEDAGSVRGGHAGCELTAEGDGPRDLKAPGRNGPRERPPVHPLHHDERPAVLIADVVDRADIRVIQRGGGAGLQLETPSPVGIGRQRRRQELDRDAACEASVAPLVDLAHPARRREGLDFIRAEPAPRCERGLPLGVRPAPRGGVEKRTRPRVLREKPLGQPAQLGILAARLGEEVGPPRWLQLERLHADRLHPLGAIGVHVSHSPSRGGAGGGATASRASSRG